MVKDNEIPLTNGSDGRDDLGRFTVGNPGGPGNPHVKTVARWRGALRDAVTMQDVEDVVKALLDKAKSGDTHAAKYLLDRCLGTDWRGHEEPEPPDPSVANDIKERFCSEPRGLGSVTPIEIKEEIEDRFKPGTVLPPSVPGLEPIAITGKS